MQISTIFIDADDRKSLTQFRGTWPEICAFASTTFPDAIIHRCDGRECTFNVQKPDVCVGPVFTVYQKPRLVRQVAYEYNQPRPTHEPRKYPANMSGMSIGVVIWRCLLFMGFVTVFVTLFKSGNGVDF